MAWGRNTAPPHLVIRFASMDTNTLASYRDVASAAHVWERPSLSFDWEQLNILSLCDHAQRIFVSDEHSNSYKLSYLKAVIDLIQQSAKAQDSEQS